MHDYCSWPLIMCPILVLLGITKIVMLTLLFRLRCKIWDRAHQPPSTARGADYGPLPGSEGAKGNE